MRWLRAHKDEKKTKLPLIVPVVFYQGRDPWWPEREFRELVEGALAEWRWVPRFEYLLVDQTLAEPEAVEGTPPARLTQTALMAAVRGGEELADRTAGLMAEVSPEGEVEVLALHVEYVLATQKEEGRRAFQAALRRYVPGRGGELMNYVEQIEERGRLEGRREGRQEGVLRTIEGLLRRDRRPVSIAGPPLTSLLTGGAFAGYRNATGVTIPTRRSCARSCRSCSIGDGPWGHATRQRTVRRPAPAYPLAKRRRRWQ